MPTYAFKYYILTLFLSCSGRVIKIFPISLSFAIKYTENVSQSNS